ncbi:AraC family transcriptional regulator [Microbaculum marinum]|uniref:AraC family transcriptional regulator n=1 Tax=Microbaculum marinum TaxID=1764581 RepID=A0AAW9RWB5_9HYPH
MTDQMQALAETGLGADDRARFWRAERYGGLECLAARFVSHRYAPHTHDTYVVGAIVAGCETFMLCGERCYAVPGDLCFVHPGDVHDGEPHGGHYAYRMSYPDAGLMRDIASGLTGRRETEMPYFPEKIVRDPDGAARFVDAHCALGSADTLAADERFVAALTVILQRHARLGAPARLGTEPGPVSRAVDYLDGHYADDVDLATLAGVAGLSRFHLIRAFRKETGLTPHAWLTDRRIRAARPLLTAGRTPGEVALECGFADQSHLTRAFKARVGVTPGRFRDASLGIAGRHAA